MAHCLGCVATPLAGAVRLISVEGRDGPINQATLTAISTTRKGRGNNKGQEATANQWTLWGKHAAQGSCLLSACQPVTRVKRPLARLAPRDGVGRI
jgi:single-strand DNA-binding protein